MFIVDNLFSMFRQAFVRKNDCKILRNKILIFFSLFFYEFKVSILYIESVASHSSCWLYLQYSVMKRVKIIYK